MSQIVYAANFNNNDLTLVNGLTVLATDPYTPPKRTVSSGIIARSNKSKVASAFYTERYITVRVNVVRATRALMEQSLDSLMTLLQGIEKILVLNQGANGRKYYATLSDTNIVAAGGSYLEMDLIFECADRFGYDSAATLLLQVTNFTSSNRSDPLNFGGSAPWQAPVITLTYSVVTGGTSKAVTIGNSNTGQQVVITRTWAAGDVIQIDSFNKTVKVNGLEVAFVGAIPEWPPGSGYWYYSDTLASRTFSAQILNTNRYT